MAAKNSLLDDLAKAVNHSLSFNKIVVMALGTIVSLVVLGLFGWLGSLIKAPGLQWLAWVIQTLGLFGAFLVLLANMTAAARMAAQEGKGDKKMSFVGGIGIAVASLTKVLFAVLKPIIFILIGIAVILGMGLIGLIPAVGPVIWGIGLGLIANITGILLVSYGMFKLLLVAFVLPGIIVEGKQQDKSYYRTAYEFIKGHVFPLLARLGIVALLIMVFLKIVVAGIAFSENTTPITMGKNQAVMTAGPLRRFVPAMGAIRIHPMITSRVVNIQSYIKASDRMMPSIAKTEHKLGGWIYSIELGVLTSIVFGMAFIFFAVSGQKAYAALKDTPAVEIKTPKVDVNLMMKKAEAIKTKVKEEMGEGGETQEQGESQSEG